MSWELLRRCFFIICFAVLASRDLRCQETPETHEYLLPHVGNGTFQGGILRTTFLMVNSGQQIVEVTLSLTSDEGGPLSLDVSNNGEDAGRSAEFTFRIAPGGSRVLRTEGSDPAVAGAATIVADGEITVSAVFSILDPDSQFVAEGGIGDSAPGESFRLPVDETGTFTTGVALFDPGPDGAHAVIDLFDISGTPQGETTVDLPPGGHLARFVEEFFNGLGLDGFRGSLRVVSDHPLAAIALRQNSSPLAFTTLPVAGEGSLQTEFDLPHIANGAFPGGSIRTTFLVFSLSGSQSSVNLQAFRSDGSAFQISLEGLGSGSSFDFDLPANGSVFLQTDGTGPVADGATRITATGAVGVAAIFSVFDPQGQFLTETGIGASTSYLELSLPVEVSSQFDTGVALFNTSSKTVDASLLLLDPGGHPYSPDQNVVQIELGPGEHLARFVSQLFQGLGDFTGALGLVASEDVVALTLRQHADPLSFTTLPVGSGARAPLSGQGTLLNELCFVSDEAHPQFVELRVSSDSQRLASGLQLMNEEGGTYDIPEGLQVDATSQLALVVFDGEDRLEGSTVHADVTDFLNPDSGALFLRNRDSLLLDRIAWGVQQRGTARIGRGGVLYDLEAGSTIARLPNAMSSLDPAAWNSFVPQQATPGEPNVLPAVEALVPLSGAVTTTTDVPLSWYPVSGMKSYRVQVSKDADFQSIVFDMESEVAAVEVDGLEPGEYFWRVQGKTAEDQLADFSPTGDFEILAQLPATALQGEGNESNDLPVPLIAQRKDTRMLLLEAEEDRGNNHRWNSAHPLTDPNDPADNFNCVLASVVMVNHAYGGHLSQDRLGYEFLKDIGPRGPEWDLSYGDAGINANFAEKMINWALRPKNGEVHAVTIPDTHTPAGLDAFWELIKTNIDHGQPMILFLIGQAGNSPVHCIVIRGYQTFNGKRYVDVRDPWQTTDPPNWAARSLEKTKWSAGYWLLPPAGQTDPRSDEATISLDSDRDGVVDFDEVNRFKTIGQEPVVHLDPHKFDTDGDLRSDFAEIHETVFDPDFGYSRKIRKTAFNNLTDLGNLLYAIAVGPAVAPSGSAVRDDDDQDGKQMELDWDSDGGGCSDGFEDSNFNDKTDSNESSNYSFLDDRCHVRGFEMRRQHLIGESPHLTTERLVSTDAYFCAGPPGLDKNGNPTAAQNHAEVTWREQRIYRYGAQNFYCAGAFTVTDDSMERSYGTDATGGTGASPHGSLDGATVFVSPKTTGIGAEATRSVTGNVCEKFNSEGNPPFVEGTDVVMWPGIGPGSSATPPWNGLILVPRGSAGFNATEDLPVSTPSPQGDNFSTLRVWFVERPEKKASEPCQVPVP